MVLFVVGKMLEISNTFPQKSEIFCVLCGDQLLLKSNQLDNTQCRYIRTVEYHFDMAVEINAPVKGIACDLHIAHFSL